MTVFDIIVVGGGHAGIEAAWIAAQFELSVGLITMPGIGLASAPCNPSVGGVGKGQVVRELDALGGLMGQLADMAGIQYRTLNDSKGLAVQSTRVQIDKDLYSRAAERLVASCPHITVIREQVRGLIREGNEFLVHTQNGPMRARKVIMTVGTFLNGKLHMGEVQRHGGRVDAPASGSLLELFRDIKTRPARFKTGTPPRILRSSIDVTRMEEQPSDPATRNFHLMNSTLDRHVRQVSCYLTHTNAETLGIIRANKERSPMYNGQIQGVGARYCPSIEDKAYRYPDRNGHHVFVEPEGLEADTVYPSGISSSLPVDVQEAFVRTIPGLENSQIKIPGYAVEYDVVDTTELSLSLEYRSLPGLYFAGQVNGTSGYEEAAGQGWVAGANAALSLWGQPPAHLSRHDSYIGVMIEDLVANTRDEPYRLFTARSENRLFIREDNSALRMGPYRAALCLNGPLDSFLGVFAEQCQLLRNLCAEVSFAETAPILEKYAGEAPFARKMPLGELLKQAWLNPVNVLADVLDQFGVIFPSDVVRTVAIELKYEGYIKRNNDQFERIQRMDATRIAWEDIVASQNVSFECRHRISKIRPETFGQLKRIEGIRPATLAVVASRAL